MCPERFAYESPGAFLRKNTSCESGEKIRAKIYIVDTCGSGQPAPHVLFGGAGHNSRRGDGGQSFFTRRGKNSDAGKGSDD